MHTTQQSYQIITNKNLFFFANPEPIFNKNYGSSSGKIWRLRGSRLWLRNLLSILRKTLFYLPNWKMFVWKRCQCIYKLISTRENQTDKHNLLGDQCFRGRMGHKNDDKARKIKKVSFPKGIQKYLKLSLSINIITYRVIQEKWFLKKT